MDTTLSNIQISDHFNKGHNSPFPIRIGLIGGGNESHWICRRNVWDYFILNWKFHCWNNHFSSWLRNDGLEHMKKGGVVLLIFALILIAGYNALSKMTVDVNPASIARDMSPEEKAEMCNALSGGTSGGFEICMDGMYLAEQGIQNSVIPDLAQPFEWANYNPGYTMQMRNEWMQKFSGVDPAFGACTFDMLASTIPLEEFMQQSEAISSGTRVESIPKVMLAIEDCTNGTFFSFSDGQGIGSDASQSGGYVSQVNGSTTTSVVLNTPGSSIESLLANDRRVATSLVDYWVPMISQKWEGLEVDGKVFDQFEVMSLDQELRYRYGSIVVWSGDYSSFFRSDMWVHIIPRKYVTSEEALNWCRNSDLTRENCGAKLLSYSKGSKGTTAWLP
jgi:hypothetical protein